MYLPLKNVCTYHVKFSFTIPYKEWKLIQPQKGTSNISKQAQYRLKKGYWTQVVEKHFRLSTDTYKGCKLAFQIHKIIGNKIKGFRVTSSAKCTKRDELCNMVYQFELKNWKSKDDAKFEVK